MEKAFLLSFAFHVQFLLEFHLIYLVLLQWYLQNISTQNRTQYSENKIITQLAESLNLYAQWFDYSYDGSENGHDYIDLGLPSGTLWATCDIGSSIPTNFGEYYSWGEVETKSTYSSSNYKWYKSGDSLNVLKYNIDPSYGIVDDKVNLDLEDDAARVNWGGDW